MDTKTIANILIQRFLQENIVLQYYHAYSTDSIYLKLDYGVCNSIRIGNHTGKEYLHYRYNIGDHITNRYTDTSGKYPKHYYPVADLDQMIQDILTERQTKINKYGLKNYQTFMQRNKQEKQNTKGFWKDAKTIRNTH